MKDKFDYAKALEKRLNKDLIERGYSTKQNKKFNINGINGECDVFILRNSRKPNKTYALVFEAKRRDKGESRKKVKEQLKKDNIFIHKKFGKDIRCFNFFAYSSKEYERNQTKKAYTIEWLRGL